MAAGGALLAREAGGGGGGGEAPCGCRESESPEGSGRGRRRRRRRMTTAPLLMLCGAATAVVAWAASLEAALAPPEEAAAAAESSPVQELSGSNWSLLLQGQWMVQFYAPWCPACQQMESAWEAFARSSQDLELHVGKVDVTQEPGVSGRFFVTTLPTIYHAKDGIFRRYRGSRSLEDLQNYILERKWESVEPVAGWKSPSSILMHGMAGLFHLSGWIRQIDNYLTGTLELPVWGSYAVFIVATLLIGLILGLILVLLADCIYPPKPRAESPDVMDPSDDKTEELPETQETTSKETHMENGLSEGEDEDESEENSSEDSAVEGSQSEEDVGHDESGQAEESSVRQRKNQVEATEL